jgi:hypothetical protein
MFVTRYRGNMRFPVSAVTEFKCGLRSQFSCRTPVTIGFGIQICYVDQISVHQLFDYRLLLIRSES